MLANQELAQQILGSLELALEAAPELSKAIESQDAEVIKAISESYTEMFTSLFDLGKEISTDNKIINLDKFCDSLLDSLNRLLGFMEKNPERALHKLEFEFFPMLQSTFQHFYFWSGVHPDPERIKNYYEHDKKLLCANTYIEEAEKSGKYKYELSIVVVGYNKLDYTKQCVESILKTVPKNINYELILLNHGSTDGTKEYFESINPAKQLDFKVNGTGGTTACRIIEGEYTIIFSNDIIAANNAVENMLRCLKSDPKIGWCVPATPNISNCQVIPASYSTPEEFEAFANVNNQYDPFRHEQRTRLCNPVSAYKTSTLFSALRPGHFFTGGKASFPDDVASMLIRRAGYKSILSKDAYCHHHGSVTIKDEISTANEQEVYLQGRQEFNSAFGVDPWGVGFCYDPHILPHIEFFEADVDEQINILGINSGLGSNPLKIKEMYKEEKHNLNALVYNITNQQNYLDDLRGVSDYVRFEGDLNNIFILSDKKFPNRFHHIVIDMSFSPSPQYKRLIMNCIDHLKIGGTLCAVLAADQKEYMCKAFPKASFNSGLQNWLIIKK